VTLYKLNLHSTDAKSLDLEDIMFGKNIVALKTLPMVNWGK
jgi:hypothetical protein